MSKKVYKDKQRAKFLERTAPQRKAEKLERRAQQAHHEAILLAIGGPAARAIAQGKR